MASADCEIAVGFSVSTAYTKAGEGSCEFSAGVGVAATRVSWGGTEARRESVDWLPPPHVPFSLDGKRLNPVWYRAFHEMFERRLGGVQGPAVTTVAQSVTDTQSQVTSVANFAQQVGQYAQGIAASVEATTEVVQNEDLPGSGSIPSLPPPPGFNP